VPMLFHHRLLAIMSDERKLMRRHDLEIVVTANGCSLTIRVPDRGVASRTASFITSISCRPDGALFICYDLRLRRPV
jgi:hypothetical protein